MFADHVHRLVAEDLDQLGALWDGKSDCGQDVPLLLLALGLPLDIPGRVLVKVDLAVFGRDSLLMLLSSSSESWQGGCKSPVTALLQDREVY